ncbi:hypothetical protein ZWY2020_058468, partial [Hordeum vulgare]
NPAARPGLQRAHVKPVPPPPEHVIEISSDTDVTKSEADDIDKLDGGSQLVVVDYIEDIYKFYKVAEILEVHQKFDLMSESLYLTVYIIDMYLLLQPLLRRELQLVGVSALLIACKYEEIWALQVNDFILISESVYTREQILKMEKAILNRLEWNWRCTLSSSSGAIRVFLLKPQERQGDGEHRLLLLRGAGATIVRVVYVARLTLEMTPLWTDTLRHHTSFTEAQLMDAAKILIGGHGLKLRFFGQETRRTSCRWHGM